MTDTVKATVRADVTNEETGELLVEGGTSAVVEYDFGKDLQEAITKFGEETVFNLYKAKAVIVVQDIIRRLLVSGSSQEDVTAFFDDYELNVSSGRQRKDPRLAAQEALKRLTPEQRAELLAQLSQ